MSPAQRAMPTTQRDQTRIAVLDEMARLALLWHEQVAETFRGCERRLSPAPRPDVRTKRERLPRSPAIVR